MKSKLICSIMILMVLKIIFWNIQIFLEEWNNLKNGNSPKTELVLTAIESFGAIYKDASKENRSEIEQALAEALNDDRWRVREIASDSYKRIGMSSYDSLIFLFDSIISKNILKFAFDYYLEMDEKIYSKDSKEVLKKGLSFAPSVIVANNPKDGFQIFEKLILRNNKETNTIIKENFRKKRLKNRYPNEVKKLLLLM